MSAPITIRMTLTGALKGVTKKLNRHQFINGVCDFTGQPTDIEGVVKYFTRCYQVKVTEPTAEEVEEDEPAEPNNEAVGVDDSAALGDEDIAEEDEVEKDEPNERQQAIIAAVNGIEKDDWIEKDTNPHPRVSDVSTLMEDPTVKKDEIIEVIEKWLS